MRSSSRRGATTIEMTLVGIPLIFVLISVFELSRGMWMYNTAATAAREGLRFASVHGVNCVHVPPGIPNACEVTANDIVKVIRSGVGNAILNSQSVSNNYGPTGAGAAGLPEATTIVRLTSSSGFIECTLDGQTAGCNSRWPPDNDNAMRQVISISIRTPFSSALSMFWPGSKPMSFGVVNLWANASDTVQF